MSALFRTKHSLGFTLIEIMVCMAIVTVIMSVVLFNYSQFNERLSLSAAAQELSVAIREAQTYGLSVREQQTGSGQFGSGYGIYLSMDDPYNYYIFADINNNQKYDGNSTCTPGGECIEKIPLRSGVFISSFCGTDAGTGIQVCPVPSARSLHVTFLRPNPDAVITFATGSGTALSTTYLTSKIILSSPKSGTVTVTIESTGQISVK